MEEARERCHDIWNSDSARFSTCALDYLPIIPVASVTALTLSFVFQSSIERWQPVWTAPFVQEYSTARGELPQHSDIKSWMWTISLVILAIGGIAAQLLLLLTSLKVATTAAVLLLVSWTLAALLIAGKRQRTCPTSLLLFFVPVLAVHLSSLSSASHIHRTASLAHGVSALLTAVSLVILLFMPYRPQFWPTDDISAVGATPKDTVRSPEDNLRMYQFLTVSWMRPLISVGKHGNLEGSNIWCLPFQFQSRRLHETFRVLQGSVLQRLCKANAVDFVIQGVIALSELVFESILPLLLNQLLRAMENPISSKRVVMTYAILSLAARMISAQCGVLLAWYGRRCYERTKAEMTMMIFEKALRRKNVVGVKPSTEPQNDAVQPSGESSTMVAKPNTMIYKLWRRFGKLTPISKSKARQVDVKQVSSIGTILNLFRGDIYEVAQRFWELDKLFKSPLGLIISATLVWKFLGPSCFLGIISLVIAQIVNACLTSKLVRYGRNRKKATDRRLQLTSQFIEVIRHLRWYSWQGHWLKQIDEARDKELYARVKFTLLETTIRFINVLSSSLFPVIAIYAYITFGKHSLSIDIIFPALQLFRMLDSRLRQFPDLITLMINASLSLRRLEEFMSEAEVESSQHATDQDCCLMLEDCSFGWPEACQPMLNNVNVTFPKGLTLVSGKVGAGKTALLQALLGEMDRFSGTAHLPNRSIGYCAQTPWLQSMSIRDNILFFSPFDEPFYNRVLDACQLLPDLRLLSDGDLSMIGENGIGLSGGQKARVALARAIYNQPEILLLDDPLSALDHDTAESIARKLFGGSLLNGRTTVLVTHRVDLVRPYAMQFVEIADGYAKVGKSEVTIKQSVPQADGVVVGNIEKDKKPPGAAAQFVEDEQRSNLSVQTKVYWVYIRAGGLQWWILEVIALIISQLLEVLYSWYLKAWGEAYRPVSLYLLQATKILVAEFNLINPIANFPPPEESVAPWLLAYLAISILQPLATLAFMLFQTVIVYCAAKRLFQDVLTRVANATFRFYDVTPTGRLMNRMTSDIANIDSNVSNQFVRFALYIIAFVTSVSVIASVAPLFLISAVVLMGALISMFRIYLPTSRSLRRLETVSLSPLFASFGELLQGLITVRAFKAQETFQNRVITVFDQCQRMDHFYWSLQAWLIYRFDTISAISTFILTALAVYTNLSSGLTAFVLVAAQNFVQSTHALCRQYGRLQMDFVSVERVEELLHIDQEPKGAIHPPASWPKYGGDIVFENVVIRYAPHMDPALKNVSVRLKGGSSFALVGRTGSGKSTFVQALLAVVRAESGSILVDGINVNEVDVGVLRDRVTYVAQDPVLFSGTIRDNLDPARQFTDDECLAALGRVSTRSGWTLETRIEAGGSNLSQGERQLIGITRAVLRRSSILIMDEATASIDNETSMEIQKILRDDMRESTVITIAHRVEVTRDVDYAIVISEGRIDKFGPPANVISG